MDVRKNIVTFSGCHSQLNYIPHYYTQLCYDIIHYFTLLYTLILM